MRRRGGMVDALASGASGLRAVEVQVLSPVPNRFWSTNALRLTNERTWRNWYTRYLEVVVGVIPWRFKSSRAHQNKEMKY